ncbi:MAG: hypothetical protein EOM91_15795 [Sphingobacteriia bacterium]|nr:hypothetical protein [Sphingobacteriia bacterium]NCC40425.1 hypothetical protein [Gammaproteobacteria bacterium]
MILKALFNPVLMLLLGIVLMAGVQAGELSLVIDESTPVIPADVEYQASGTGLEVTGWVRKRFPRHGRILGHVEIHLLDDQGRVLTQDQGSLVHFSPTRRNPEKASFTAVVPTVPPGTASILVSHRVGEDRR